MGRLFRELRRREVFRAAGLYVGIAWIVIEACSVLLPTFDAPEWVLRAVVIVAVVGFPITIVLAWVYDITKTGIVKQADPTDTYIPPLGGRGTDFVVIGVLSVALIFSVYMNIMSGPAVVEEKEPVSVLIADFDNQTGNPVFDGLLEQALNVGIEVAPHVTSFQRNQALGIADRIQPGVKILDMGAARLVAVREGINFVLAGSIIPDGAGFELDLHAVDPNTGETAFDVSSDAKSQDGILAAVGDLSGKVREELGDDSLGKSESATTETFTAASIEAAQDYTQGLAADFEGRHEDAIDLYRRATEKDPNFGRAYSSWANNLHRLGRTEEAAELWQKAATLLDTMTERERLRTLGLYYAGVTGNLENAKQSFSELVGRYPADAAGHNNLAVISFMTLDFEAASREGKQILDIYPSSQLYRANYGLYSMYAGDFEAGAAEALALIEDDPEYGTAYLLLAMKAMSENDFAAASDAYEKMALATKSPHTASVAQLGLADLSIYSGKFAAATELLQPAIRIDLEDDSKGAAATKYLALAESFVADGRKDEAVNAARQALELAGSDAHVVPAARVMIEAGQLPDAVSLLTELSKKLRPQSRAYGRMIQGMIASAQGEHIYAIDNLRKAVEFADLWLVRFELGRAYLRAKFFAEALDEFRICAERRGEATAAFLDDTPTYRYLADLGYWRARAQQGLGMQTAAIQGFEEFLALRPQGGPLADDARQRMP